MRPAPRAASAETVNFQFRQPDTALFGTIDGLATQSGASQGLLLRMVLKEAVDNALDAADKAGRSGQVEIERLAEGRWLIADAGNGIAGTPEELAAIFAFGREMVSGKRWRLPERGARGNGLRVIVGAIAATGGTIEVTTNDQRVLLLPQKNGTTLVVEHGPAVCPIGTRLILDFGAEMPTDAQHKPATWAERAIALAKVAGPPYAGLPSPLWYDRDYFFVCLLSTIEPVSTTIRQLLERLDGCSGRKGAAIAAAFGKGRTCRSLTEVESGTLLAALQAAVRPVRPLALGLVGAAGCDPDLYDYAHTTGEFTAGHSPVAKIPYLVEAWVSVQDRKGIRRLEAEVLVNRTPAMAELSAYRWGERKLITLSGAGLDFSIEVPAGDCSVTVHVTSPLVPITSLGKRVDLSPFQVAMGTAIRTAFIKSRNRLPPDPKPQSDTAGTLVVRFCQLSRQG
jgi:hypothetical protein